MSSPYTVEAVRVPYLHFRLIAWRRLYSRYEHCSSARDRIGECFPFPFDSNRRQRRCYARPRSSSPNCPDRVDYPVAEYRETARFNITDGSGRFRHFWILSVSFGDFHSRFRHYIRRTMGFVRVNVLDVTRKRFRDDSSPLTRW